MVRYVPKLDTVVQGILRPVSTFVELKVTTAVPSKEKGLPLRWEMFQQTWLTEHVRAGGNAMLAVWFSRPMENGTHGVVIRVTEDFREVIQRPLGEMLHNSSICEEFDNSSESICLAFERLLSDMA